MVDSVPNAGISVLSQFADIQKKVNEAVANVRKEKEELAKNPNLKGPSGPVQEFQKTNNKSSSNLKFFATDIGLLVKDTTRLNVISTLAAGDTADFYKFRSTGRGDAFLGRVGDEGVRVQLMSKTGMVVADSNKDAGEAFARYGKLTQGKLELAPGEYHLRVTRDKGVEAKEKLNFALQLRMGDYKQDYDTVVKQPKAGDDPFRPSAGVQELQSMLNQSAAFLNNLQIGRSGSDKLLGSMFSGFA